MVKADAQSSMNSWDKKAKEEVHSFDYEDEEDEDDEEFNSDDRNDEKMEDIAKDLGGEKIWLADLYG